MRKLHRAHRRLKDALAPGKCQLCRNELVVFPVELLRTFRYFINAQ